MQKVRVLLANRPRLMQEIVLATLANQPDIEVVGETQKEEELTELVDSVRPDFVVVSVGEPESRPGICGFLLGRYPQMKVLAIMPEKNIAVCHWAFVELRSKRFQMSEEGLLRVLRSPTSESAPLADTSLKRVT